MVATTTATRLQGEQEVAWVDYQEGGLSFQEGWARQRGLLDRCEQEARRQLSVLMELLQKEQKLATNTERKADTHDASSSPQQISAAAPQQRSAPAAAPKQTSAAASAPPQQTWSVNILSSFLQQRHGQEEEEKEEKDNVEMDEGVKEKGKLVTLVIAFLAFLFALHAACLGLVPNSLSM